MTREQLERIEREVEKHHRFYVRVWKRVQANDMKLDDPLVQGICDAWKGINHLLTKIDQLKGQLTQP